MQQKLSLEALAVIDAIERRGSFARAADELGKATSALSYTVQKLEEQLDTTLFQRQGRQSVLTPAGRLLLDEGRKILTASHLLADQVRELAAGWESRIRIAVESTCDYDRVFEAVGRFLQSHSGIELDIQESVLSGGWEALEHDRVDLLVGVPAPVPQHKGIRTQRIESIEMVLVAARDHPCASAIGDDTALEKAIAQARRVVTHDTATTNVERSAGLLSNSHTLYVQTIGQKIAAQCAGLGIGHLPRLAINELLASGDLVALNMAGNQTESYLAWKLVNKGRGLAALVTLLTDKCGG